MRNLTTIHVSPFPDLSGANRSMLTLVNCLQETGNVFAFGVRRGGLTEACDSLHIPCTVPFEGDDIPGSRLRRWWRCLSALRTLSRQSDADLLHGHSAMAARYVVPVSEWCRAPSVIHQRDNYSHSYFHVGLGWADQIISISQHVHRQLPPTMQRKSTVIYNAVALPELHTESRRPGPLRVGTAGRCTPDKGYDLLVEAWSQTLGVAESELHIWGVDPDRGSATGYRFDFLRKVDSLPEQLRDRVNLQPFRNDIHNFFREMDIIIVPSRYAEPFGRMAIEAMAWAKPLIVADHGGLAEIIRHAGVGVGYEPGRSSDLAEQLRHMLRDDGFRAEQAAGGREAAITRFSPQAHASRVMEVYDDVLRRKRR